MAGENDELDKYINDVSGLDDTDVSTDVTTDNDHDGVDNERQPNTGTANDTPDNEAAQVQAKPTDSTTPTKKVDDPKGKQPKQGTQDAAQSQIRPLGDGTFANAKGDIVDKDGKLIAQGGFAARMYTSNRRLKAITDQQGQELEQLHRSVGEFRALSTSIQQYGLDNNEVAQALDFAGRMKRGDMIGVAKDIIAMVTAQGYNVTDILGQDVGDSIEMRGLKRMIDERLAPIMREKQDSVQQTQAAQRAKQAYDTFVATNEFADVHADAIVGVMRRENVNAQVAYNRIMQFAMRNNLDFSQPLGPQIEARQNEMRNRNGHGQQQQQQNGRVQQKPMPNGASTRSPGAVPAMPLADADDDWGSIISQVQRTIGNA